MKKSEEMHLSRKERSLVRAIESDLDNLLVTIDHVEEVSGIKFHQQDEDPCNSFVNGQLEATATKNKEQPKESNQ